MFVTSASVACARTQNRLTFHFSSFKAVIGPHLDSSRWAGALPSGRSRTNQRLQESGGQLGRSRRPPFRSNCAAPFFIHLRRKLISLPNNSSDTPQAGPI